MDATHENLYSRRALARHLGTSLKALRHYESRGLIPVQVVGGKKRYGRDAIERIRLVSALVEIGFSTDEIRLLVGPPDGASLPSETAKVMGDRLEAATQRIAERLELLQRIRQELVAAREAVFRCAKCERACEEACQECDQAGRIPPMARTLVLAK